MGKQCPQVAEQVIVDIYQLGLRQAASKLTGLLGQVPHPPTHHFSQAAAVHFGVLMLLVQLLWLQLLEYWAFFVVTVAW